jgi:hypothetical protein
MLPWNDEFAKKRQLLRGPELPLSLPSWFLEEMVLFGNSE